MQKDELLARSVAFLSGETALTPESLEELKGILRAHNELYYVHSDPVVSDQEYDRLFKLLEKGERELGIFDPNSPTNHIDVMLSRQFEKGKHLSPMISLDNTYDVADVLEFGKRARRILGREDPLPSCLELKFDGLGISILYRDGKLVRALTRGNGIEGEDITVNALEIKSIPKYIPYDGEIEIRGEVIMPHAAFARVNEERMNAGEKLFANPRNAASGSLRQLDPTITRSRGLEFYGYSVPAFERSAAFGIASYREYNAMLAKWGFLTSPFFEYFTTIEALADRISELQANRPKFPFDIDGLVLKFDELEIWSELGATEHHPRSAIAYKFPQENVRTRIVFVEHSVGRTGIVTPVAHLEPVAVTGVIVRRATLHNYEETERKDVRVGDSVFIVRAGEVIPEVVSVITDIRTGSETPIVPPEACPSCGTPLVKDDGKVAYYCPNSATCPAQTSGSLKAFVSKHAANIDGMGEKIIDLFIEKGFLTDFVSIYHLHEHREEILELEGFEQKRTDHILEGIEASRTMELPRLLLALCIPEVGRKTAKILAGHLASKRTSDETALELLKGLTYDELIAIKDIGPVATEEILDYVADNAEMLERLFVHVQPTFPEAVRGGVLAGKSFCVTGSFETKSRDEIHEIIEANGGEVRTGVSAKLNYLIVGSDAGSKLEKAKELGVQTLSLEEFEAMV